MTEFEELKPFPCDGCSENVNSAPYSQSMSSMNSKLEDLNRSSTNQFE